MAGLELSLSLHSFTDRNRDGTLVFECRVALASEEADEMEEERELSETIDSGEDVVEIELASDDRRTGP